MIRSLACVFGTCASLNTVGLSKSQEVLSRLRGPTWFRKMDRNADGDISRAEFLGTGEQFRKLDLDGDALIGIAEAEAAGKRNP